MESQITEMKTFNHKDFLKKCSDNIEQYISQYKKFINEEYIIDMPKMIFTEYKIMSENNDIAVFMCKICGKRYEGTRPFTINIMNLAFKHLTSKTHLMAMRQMAGSKGDVEQTMQNLRDNLYNELETKFRIKESHMERDLKKKMRNNTSPKYILDDVSTYAFEHADDMFSNENSYKLFMDKLKALYLKIENPLSSRVQYVSTGVGAVRTALMESRAASSMFRFGYGYGNDNRSDRSGSVEADLADHEIIIS